MSVANLVVPKNCFVVLKSLAGNVDYAGCWVVSVRMHCRALGHPDLGQCFHLSAPGHAVSRIDVCIKTNNISLTSPSDWLLSWLSTNVSPV